MLMPLLRLMRNRATELFTGAMTKYIVKLNSTGKPELAEGWRLNLSAFPLKRAPHAEWNNEIGKGEALSALIFPER